MRMYAGDQFGDRSIACDFAEVTLSLGFVDAWISPTRDRKLSLGGRAADDALIQQRLAEAIWNIDVTVTRLRADIAELWQMAEAGVPASMQLRAQVR